MAARLTRFLLPGNDPAGLNVGFLFKIDPAAGGHRTGFEPSERRAGGPSGHVDRSRDNEPALLNDRPSLVLQGTVSRAPTAGFPIVVVVTDLLRLDAINESRPMDRRPSAIALRKRQAAAQGLLPTTCRPASRTTRPNISSSSELHIALS